MAPMPVYRSYPEHMESEHNSAIFNGMYQLQVRLSSAVDRCRDISKSEHVMGYTESAKQYDEMATELGREVKPWIDLHMRALIQLE